MYTYPEACEALHRAACSIVESLTGHPFARSRLQILPSPDAHTASVIWTSPLTTPYSSLQITLPLRKATTRMTQEEFDDWVAYLVHELGHPLATSKACWEDACRAGLQNLTNALEDVRMEKVLIDGGKVANVKAVLARLLERKLADSKPTYDPSSLKDLTWTLCVLGRFANGYAVDGAWVKARIKASGRVDAILAWALPALAQCKTTRDCVKLAERIKQASTTPKPPQPPVNPNPTPKLPVTESPQEAPTEAGDEQATETPDDTLPPQGEAPEGLSGDDEDMPEDETPEGGAGGSQGGFTPEKDEDAQDDEQVADDKDMRDVNLAPVMGGETLKGREASTQAILIDIIRGSMSQKREGLQTGGNGGYASAMQERIERNSAKCGRQRALIARALKSEEQDDREGGMRVGRLARGGIVRSQLGEQNVLTRRHVTEGHDTDVMVLIDGSGSMDGAKVALANEVAMVVAQAAASVGVSCGVEQFKGSTYYVVKATGRTKPQTSAFADAALAAGGGTPLSENVARISLQQAKRAGHKRRIVFLITDGGCNRGSDVAAQMARYCETTYGTIFAHVSIDNPLTGAYRAEVMLRPGVGMAGAALDHFARVLETL